MFFRNTNLFYVIFVIGLAIVPLIAIEVPRFLGFYPAIFGIIMSVWAHWGLKIRLSLPSAYLHIICAICLLIIISSIWSLNQQDALEKAIIITINLSLCTLFLSLCNSIKTEDIGKYLIFIPIFMIIAALFCSYELISKMQIYRIIHAAEGKIGTSVMNRGIIFYSLCFFPVLALIPAIKIPTLYRQILTGFYIGSMLLLMYLTESQSAQLGIIAGFIGFTLFPTSQKWSYTVLSGIIAIAVLMTPLLAKLLFYYGFYGFAEYSWMKDGYAGHRLEIWDFVMRYAMQNPLYGFGLEATRYVENFDHDYLIHKQPTVLHPHNFSVQIWIEFGAIGATFASTLITFILYRCKNMKKTQAKTAISLFFSILSISATAYGMWQAWWIGAIIFSIGLTYFAQNNNFAPKSRINITD